MIISGENLRLTYYNSKMGFIGLVMDVKDKERTLAFDLQPGQKINSITYSDCGVNKLLNYHVKIKAVNEEGVRFEDWDGKEKFYKWEITVSNSYGKIEKLHLIIEPCEHLYEEPRDLQELLDGRIQHDEGIWYKHGGRRTTSKYEENLQYFTLLGQQKLF